MRSLAVIMVLFVLVFAVGCTTQTQSALDSEITNDQIVEDVPEDIAQDIVGVDPEDDYVEIGEMI